MSLYNALFGVNPLSGVLLKMLSMSPSDVPRFRDCYINGNDIVIHTRTGGGNRDRYEHEDLCRSEFPEYFNGEDKPNGPWNADLRKHPWFTYDEDDDFDSTYADFHYKVPEEIKPYFEYLRDMGGETKPPAEKWQKLFKDMDAGHSNKEVDNAMNALKPVFEQIKDFVEKP